jgi:DNA invertase Pin-like site-specific DNA recombinase
VSSKRTLYPYSRFSTGEQKHGNSTARQSAPLAGFLRSHPVWALSPDTEFDDPGRSGRGAHLGRRGGLGRFMTLVRANVVKPGSGLAIENWDRLTRMKLDKSLELIREILRAGVAVVIVPTGEVYEPSGLSDPMVWTRLVWEFERAYREGERRAEYARDNWGRKRQDIQERKIVTAWCPFWLTVWQGGQPLGSGRGKLNLEKDAPVPEYRENDKADIVRLVFEMADKQNAGGYTIVKELARRGLRFRTAETLTIATVTRLLANPSVIGTYVPRLARDERGRRAAAGDEVPGYYPAVISEEQFHRVQVGLRRREKKGRGRTGNGVKNLFTGLLVEKETQSPMYVKTSHGRDSLVSKASIKGTTTRTVEFPLDVFEAGVLGVCRELSPSLLTPTTPASETVKRCEEELVALAGKILREQGRYDAAKDVAEEESASSNLSRLFGKKKELEKERDTAAAEVSSAPADQLRQLHKLSDLLATVKEKDRVSLRSNIKGVLATLIEKVEVYVQKKGKPRREEKRAWVKVVYKTGAIRFVLLQGGVIVTVPHCEDKPFVVPDHDGWA